LVFRLGVIYSFSLALYACLTIKDPFYLPNTQKMPYFILAVLVPFVGSVVALNRANRGNSKTNSDNIFAVGSSGDSSGCSGGEGGGGE
jgi:hypothetical protein